ncbi:uncharacterized protein LOC128812999 [Vidua macroura]|uniref:uncharacterized protein LOC128812999 n=1 Tax=Vidua macroura TaxID=187451 RepID=UPI0023A825B7|nr:uncharacterized protein LOC128812999 [Vidua macroura]
MASSSVRRVDWPRRWVSPSLHRRRGRSRPHRPPTLESTSSPPALQPCTGEHIQPPCTTAGSRFIGSGARCAGRGCPPPAPLTPAGPTPTRDVSCGSEEYPSPPCHSLLPRPALFPSGSQRTRTGMTSVNTDSLSLSKDTPSQLGAGLTVPRNLKINIALERALPCRALGTPCVPLSFAGREERVPERLWLGPRRTFGDVKDQHLQSMDLLLRLSCLDFETIITLCIVVWFSYIVNLVSVI